MVSPRRILFKDSIKPGKSTDQVIDVLSTFFTFLERNRYTAGNPAASLVRIRRETGPGQHNGSLLLRSRVEICATVP